MYHLPAPPIAKAARQKVKCIHCGKWKARLAMHINHPTNSACKAAYTNFVRKPEKPTPLEPNEFEAIHYDGMRISEVFKDVSEWIYFRYMSQPHYQAVRAAHG